MSFKTTYILFGILGVVLLVFAAALIFSPTGTAGDTAYVLPSVHGGSDPIRSSDIETVEIQRTKPADEKLVFVYDQDRKTWKMTQPHELRVDSSAVNRLVDQVLDAKQDEKADTTSNLQQWGLDQPATTVTLKQKGGGRELKLFVGKEGRGVVYVDSSDRKEPMAVRSNDLDSISKNYKDFWSKDLLSGTGAGSFFDIDYAKLQDPRSEVVLQKTADGNWRFEKPPYGEANYDETPPSATPGQSDKHLDTVKAVLGAVEGIRVPATDDFVTPDADDLGKYGLQDDKPAHLRIAIKRKQGDDKPQTESVLLIGKKTGASEKKGEKPDPNAGMYYARLAGEKAVVKVNAADVNKIIDVVNNPEVLRDRNLVKLDEAKTDAIDIKNASGLIKLRRPETATWEIYEGNAAKGRKAEFDTVKDLIKALDERGQVKKFPDPAQEDKLGFNKPDAVTVSVWVEGLQKQEPKSEEKKDEQKDQKKEEKKDDKKPADAAPKLKSDKPTVTLTFGNKENGLVYVRRDRGGDKTLVAVPDNLLALVDRPELAYLDRTIPSFSQNADATKLVIVRGGETYELVKEKDKTPAVWKITQPKNLQGRTADAAKVDRIVSELSGLHAQKLVAEKAPESDLKRWGLAPAQVQATVTVLGDDKKPKDWVYLFGNETDDRKTRYARQGDRDLVFQVNADVIGPLQSDLTSLQIFSFDPAKVKELKLVGWKKVEKRTTTLDVVRNSADAKAWKVKNDLGDFELNGGQVDQLVSDLASLRAEHFVAFKSGPKLEYELGDKDRNLQVEITVEGEKAPLTLVLGKLDPAQKGYYAESSVLPGDVFLVAQDRFEKLVNGGIKYFSK